MVLDDPELAPYITRQDERRSVDLVILSLFRGTGESGADWMDKDQTEGEACGGQMVETCRASLANPNDLALSMCRTCPGVLTQIDPRG